MILPKAELTPSGRPKLVAGEVERVLLDKVDIEFEESGCTEGCAAEKAYKSGYCVVTSHKLLWIDAAASPSPGRSCHMPLDTIHSVQKRVQYGLNVMNPKVRLEVKVFVDRHSKLTNMQASAAFKYLALRCRGEAPDTFQEQLSTALAAHRTLMEQQQRKQQQQQQQQQAQGSQQQPYSSQQQAVPWASNAGPVSHPIAGPLATGSFDGPLAPGLMWGDSSSSQHHQQQQQQYQGGGLPSRSPAGHRMGLQAVDGELLTQLMDMGFPRPRVVRALLASNNETLQAALDWILAAGDDPTMDTPLPVPEPAVVTKHELQRLQQLNMLQQNPAAAIPHRQGPPGFYSQEQQLQPGWGMGSVSAAAATPGGVGGCRGHQGGSWSAVGPLIAGLGSPGSRSSPRKASELSLGSGGSGSSMCAPGAGGMGPGPSGGSSSSSRMVGVAGIMTREAAKTSQSAQNLAVAFQDLDALMDMAAEMVKLAEKFRGVMGADGAITLSPTPASSSSSLSSMSGITPSGSGGRSDGAAAAGGSDQLLLDSETQLQLIAMGITSPVTRASAGARYHQELARQLADFLSGPLGRAGGVMLLPDVYCLFNRARGTELVSPDDLLQACDAFTQVGLPLRLRKFPSGVIVVQGSQFSDTQLCKNIEQLLQQKSQGGAAPGSVPSPDTLPTPPGGSSSTVAGLGPALSAADVSAALVLPMTLAKEALLVAEASGVLCRDDGPEGLRFFRNFFREAMPVAF